MSCTFDTDAKDSEGVNLANVNARAVINALGLVDDGGLYGNVPIQAGWLERRPTLSQPLDLKRMLRNACRYTAEQITSDETPLMLDDIDGLVEEARP